VQTYWPPATTVGILLMDGAIAVLIYLLLACSRRASCGHASTGRSSASSRSPSARSELLWLLFYPLPDGLNVLAIWPDAAIADAIDWAQRVLLTFAGTALVTVLVHRWLRASPPSRRCSLLCSWAR
jgi:hypothetical protein